MQPCWAEDTNYSNIRPVINSISGCGETSFCELVNFHGQPHGGVCLSVIV